MLDAQPGLANHQASLCRAELSTANSRLDRQSFGKRVDHFTQQG